MLHSTIAPGSDCPPGRRFTGRIPELESAIAAFDLGGTTAFYDALLMSQSQLRSAGYSKVLLTITDGGDNSATRR